MISVIINTFHILLVLFTIIAPFTNRPGLLLLHISYSVSLLTHWYLNSNSCCLTLLESSLTGKDSNDTFMHKLISPMYSISESDLSTLVWIFTILLMLISSYKLYNYISSLEKIELVYLFNVNPVTIP